MNEGSDRASVCVACGAPISAEGAHICWECQKAAKEKESMNHQVIKAYGDMIDSTIEGLNELKSGLALGQQEQTINVFKKPIGGIRRIVAEGHALDVFSVGDQIIVHHKVFGDLIFAVYDFDAERFADKRDEGKHSMTIGLLDIPDWQAFDKGGRNGWEGSSLRKWLNDEKNGFLSGFSVAFQEAICETVRITAKNTVTDGGGFTETNDRFFLLSRTEVFGDRENGIAEGKQYPFFQTAENRIKHDAEGDQRFYWLRSPNSGYGHIARHVYADGAIDNNRAVYGYGVAPVCTIR